MSDQKLLDFIKTARERGFEDYQIREPLLAKGWPVKEVDSAFLELKSREKKIALKSKTKIEILIDNTVLKSIEKRANRNIFTLNEQIEDILRRSCVNLNKKKGFEEEKLDDKFIALFSRKKQSK